MGDKDRSAGGGRRWRLVRAPKGAVPRSVGLFAQRARRRRLRTAMPYLIAALILALVVGGGAVVYTTSLLGVVQIRVAGAVVASPEEVRAFAAVRRGTPLARVDLGVVAARVEGLAAVRDARVVRDWPRALVIHVVERTPVAVVPLDEWWASIDEAGVPFISDAERPAGLPMIRIAAPGPRDGTTRAALAVLRALNDELRGRLVALIAEAPTRISLSLAEDRTIIWGDATDNEAKVRVATALLSRPDKVMDVSAPSVVTIR